MARSYFEPRYRLIRSWLRTSNEVSNFTYPLKRSNLLYLAQCVSVVTGRPVTEIRSYIDEITEDQALKRLVIETTRKSPYRDAADERCEFGRRIGWYAITRATKPKVVVETGVDKGLGALALCRALKKNAEEGHQGRYFGTDIQEDAGYLLAEPYQTLGKILVGDSIASLTQLQETIDLFINDSDHSAEYEYREYQVIKGKLSENAIILGDNAHATDALSRFSLENQRNFLFFKEEPEGHWYPGAGIGISFR